MEELLIVKENEDVYVLPHRNAFDMQSNSVRMYIQYGNINETMVLPIPITPDPSLYVLTNPKMALDKHGNLVHYPFHGKVTPLSQCQLDEYIYHISNEIHSINENQILNYFVWEAFMNYINSPHCNKRRQEKQRRKEETEFWCY